jgi:mono/diheme cytochrome c family protein
MRLAKYLRVLIVIALVALPGAMLLAACGGGGGGSAETTATEGVTTPVEETEEAPAEEEPGSEESAEFAEGESIFTSTCGSCHTLKEAGTSGEVGPNLDELEPSQATVEKQVTHGGGGMPAFGGTLSKAEIKTVALYVSVMAGTE